MEFRDDRSGDRGSRKTHKVLLFLQEPLEGNVKLYESKAIHGLLVDHRETPSLAMNDWDHIQRLLVREPLDA